MRKMKKILAGLIAMVVLLCSVAVSLGDEGVPEEEMKQETKIVVPAELEIETGEKKEAPAEKEEPVKEEQQKAEDEPNANVETDKKEDAPALGQENPGEESQKVEDEPEADTEAEKEDAPVADQEDTVKEPQQDIEATPVPEPEPENEEEALTETVTVVFVSPSGETVETLEKGTPVAEPEVQPALKGHVFLCWFNEEAEEEHRFNEPVNESITLTARFEALAEDVPKEGETAGEGLEESETDGEEMTDEEAPQIPEASIELFFEGDKIYLGDRVTFVVSVEGDVAIQWQYSQDGGETWENVGGETGREMSIVISEENAAYLWRVEITY